MVEGKCILNWESCTLCENRKSLAKLVLLEAGALDAKTLQLPYPTTCPSTETPNIEIPNT